VNCLHCGRPLPAGSRRDRSYCNNNCSARASDYRRKNGIPLPPRWQHPALTSDVPQLRAAAERASQLSEANGWSSSTTRCAIDGLAVLLADRPDGERVTLTEIRSRTGRHTSAPRVAEVLTGLGLLEDDRVPAVRAWIGRRTAELPPGFAAAVRDWLLVLLDGDRRSRPRSATTIYVYCTAVEPLIGRWSTSGRCHLREVTADDIRAGLEDLRGHPLCTAISAVRSLFRFAKKRGLIFADPARRLSAAEPEPSILPMTDDEIEVVEQAITLPGQRLIVALAAVHAARWKAIQALTLDDLDLPNRRITIAGHPQRLGDLSHQALRAWLDYRRATWPHSPNRHVLISKRTALGDQPVTRGYVNFHLGPHGVSVERIRRDRILHEALTGRPDPLHLTLMFGISDRPASQYARIARDLLAEPPGPEVRLAVRSNGHPPFFASCGKSRGIRGDRFRSFRSPSPGPADQRVD
jgi:integrase